MDIAPPSPTGTTLGPLKVSTDLALVRTFASASRCGAEAVPSTFPIAWLTHPAIKAAVENSVRSGEVAFHEEQEFDYHRPLAGDVTYQLTARLERTEAPARLRLTAQVMRDDIPVLTMRTVLRLMVVLSAPAGMQAAAAQQ